MVKLKHHGVSLAAVNTGMRRQVLSDQFTVLVAPLLIGGSRLAFYLLLVALVVGALILGAIGGHILSTAAHILRAIAPHPMDLAGRLGRVIQLDHAEVIEAMGLGEVLRRGVG